MSDSRCFFLEPTGQAFVALRRYSDSQSRPCATGSYHNAMTPVGTLPVREVEHEDGRRTYELAEAHPNPAHEDPRWPTVCERCGYAFQEDDIWQPWYERLYRRLDTGEEMTIRDAPAGALWYADWMPASWWHGPDGRVLMCRTPGGDWNIDSRASNCTLRDDNEHRCWVRHGDPRNPPSLTVDKNGLTCAAGAGSIQAGSFHGFLRDGVLIGA